MSEGLTAEEVHEAIDQTVMELLDSAGILAPPVDAVELARRLGLPTEPQRERRGAGRKQALLRADPAPERRQWVAAHDLARHAEGELYRRLGMDPGQRGLAGGSLLNLFADRLLVPTGWLAGEARQADFDLLALKERFHTASHELIAWRLLDLPEPCVITVIDNDQVSRRRGNAGRVPRELAAAERRCLDQVHRYSRPAEVNEGGWRVQGWPVHRLDWRREILRSQVEEW